MDSDALGPGPVATARNGQILADQVPQAPPLTVNVTRIIKHVLKYPVIDSLLFVSQFLRHLAFFFTMPESFHHLSGSEFT